MSCHTYHCLVVVSFCILYSFTCQNETRKTTRFDQISFLPFRYHLCKSGTHHVTQKSPSATKCHYNLHFYSNLIYFHPFMNRHEYKSMSNNFLKSHEFFSLNFSTILIIKQKIMNETVPSTEFQEAGQNGTLVQTGPFSHRTLTGPKNEIKNLQSY